MILSRTKAAILDTVRGNAPMAVRPAKSSPKLEEFISKRDFTAAIALLELEVSADKPPKDALLWLGYSYYHMGDFKKALKIYERLKEDPKCDPMVHVHLGCCLFFLGMYKEADQAANKGTACKLQTRLLFHLSHKLNDEKRLMEFHQQLEDIVHDQLTLASIHYLRNHFQEAIDIYKRLLLEFNDHVAINVYIALCYYKLDYFDVSQEILSVYLQHDPTSITAVNLKACNYYRLYNGKAAETELQTLSEKASPHFRYAEDLIKHNLVVFRNGDGALQSLPPLVDVLPEARLNLVLYHLHHDEISNAFDLVKDMDPMTPQEYTIKAIAYTAYAEAKDSPDHYKLAQQYFQLVGSSSTECDTIHGRQCMASCFILLQQWDDALIYLNSIMSYLSHDDVFNLNFAQVKVAQGKFDEAEEALHQIKGERHLRHYVYLSHLAYCYVMNGKAGMAWELYLGMDTSVESFNLLHLVANYSYQTEQFYIAAKAFDVLERLDPSAEYWEGKRGACVGAFKQIVEGKDDSILLRDIVSLLRNTMTDESERIVLMMRMWAQKNRVML